MFICFHKQILFAVLSAMVVSPANANLKVRFDQPPAAQLSELGAKAVEHLESLSGRVLTSAEVASLANSEVRSIKASRTASLQNDRLVTRRIYCIQAWAGLAVGASGAICVDGSGIKRTVVIRPLVGLELSLQGAVIAVHVYANDSVVGYYTDVSGISGGYGLAGSGFHFSRKDGNLETSADLYGFGIGAGATFDGLEAIDMEIN